MRVPAQPNRPRTSRLTSFPAPTGGWVANRNLAKPNQYGTQPGAAVLENFFPIANSAIMRRGSELYATIGDGTKQVDTIFRYVNGATQKLFASISTNIYDITNGASPSSVLGTLTSGDWSVVQFATSGGVFLRGVNGTDTPFVYDGSTWGTTPAITFTDGTTADQLNYVWAAQNRLWFIKKNSLYAYYIDPAAIGGAATAFPMGGIFSRGGSLLFGAQWSIETLAGMDQRTVFVTTEGEAAVYQGNDPSSATTWSLVGVYRIGKPLGPKAWIRAGGDIVIATDIGFVALSQALTRDFSVLSESAVSFPIETEWNDAVAQRAGANWHCEVWPTNQMAVVALPTVAGTTPAFFVSNVRTGAWAKYSGWDATCLAVYNEGLYFGSQAGKIVQANVTGADQGIPYTSTYIPLFDDLRSSGSLKIGRMGRAALRCDIPVTENLTLNTDFDVSTPPAPDATPVAGVSVWGTGIWGQSVWGAASSPSTQQNWKSLSGMGYALAPCLQITSGSVAPLDAQIVRVEMTYDMADLVT